MFVIGILMGLIVIAVIMNIVWRLDSESVTFEETEDRIYIQAFGDVYQIRK